MKTLLLFAEQLFVIVTNFKFYFLKIITSNFLFLWYNANKLHYYKKSLFLQQKVYGEELNLCRNCIL